MRVFYICLLYLILFFPLSAQIENKKEVLSSPLDIPLLLSANFGELRQNHFHSGLDFKTSGTINKRVYSIADGYVSRIGVNAAGYGLVLYITHPNGYTSVYAHLNKFNSKIEKFVRDYQYAKESYVVSIENIDPMLFPVKKGEFVALSGNTGSSGGPHLHFEVRRTADEHSLDPFFFFDNKITDNTPPEVRGIAVYTTENIIDAPFKSQFAEGKKLTEKKPVFESWGPTYFGIFAYDKMDGTSNIYGVKEIELYCNNEKIFKSNIEEIDFSTSQMINSLVDYDKWKKDNRPYVKSIKEPGNRLNIYEENLPGYIDVKDGEIYNLRYILQDYKGNKKQYSFQVKGKERSMHNDTLKSNAFKLLWNLHNIYKTDNFSLLIPSNSLYRNSYFSLYIDTLSINYSPIFQLNKVAEPLQKPALLSINIVSDTLSNKQNYGLAKLDKKGKKYWIGGKYENGILRTEISDLGNRYTITADTIAPEITPVSKEDWAENKAIKLKVSDDLSGVKKIKGTIDGEFVLFEHDIKSPIYIYRVDEDKILKGQNHSLQFEVWDKAGNYSIYDGSFKY